MRRMFFILLATALFCAITAAQDTEKASSNPTNSEPISGKQLYSSHCALCHGAEAKGGGPFSTQLKTWPPDLTQLTKKNKGVFPAMRVAETIDGEFDKPAHGAKEMPIWGPVFRSLAHGRKDSAQVRIDHLVRYLESMQQK